jgi:hypothetical protein
LALFLPINYSRNRLDFQTKDGATIQDKAKSSEYLQIANIMMKEFEERVHAIKVTKNAEQAFGSMSSQYRHIKAF